MINLFKYKQVKRIHFVGIKGVGVSALAQVLKKLGFKVSGSDGKSSFFTDKILKKAKIKVKQFSAKNISKNIDLVITSAAYFDRSPGFKSKNSEITKAFKLGIPIKTYPEIIGDLFDMFNQSIAVAGTHGKSTSSSILALILERAGLDPWAVIGTEILEWKNNARVSKTKSPVLVAEADEYREAFLHYNPRYLLINNIEYDHPDFFPTKESYFEAFEKMVKNINFNGLLLVNGDDKKLYNLAKNSGIIANYSFGFKKYNDFIVKDERIIDSRQYFSVKFNNRGKKLNFGEFNVSFPGIPYILDSAAALIFAFLLGVNPEKSRKVISEFKGTRRRLERIKNGFFDDYAHHPTAIKLTLEGLKRMCPKKEIWVVFQPHTFSRTKVLLDEFAKSFGSANKVILMDIFGSAREKKGKVSGKSLFNKTKKYRKNVFYGGTVKNSAEIIKKFRTLSKNREKPIIITMGAGDVYKVIDPVRKSGA